MSDNWVMTFEEGLGKTQIFDKDGVSWHKAPLPRRWHIHRVQTYGFMNYFSLIERCACGAIRTDSSRRWHSRNERRKSS